MIFPISYLIWLMYGLLLLILPVVLLIMLLNLVNEKLWMMLSMTRKKLMP